MTQISPPDAAEYGEVCSQLAVVDGIVHMVSVPISLLRLLPHPHRKERKRGVGWGVVSEFLTFNHDVYILLDDKPYACNCCL